MKKLIRKKTTGKVLTPLSAFAAMIALGVPGAHAQDIFNATFPASWSGTGTTVTDPGTTDVGYQSGTATYSTSAVPPGAAAGTGSMALNGAGGIKVTPAAVLNNTAVANAGGFTYDIEFMWNGATSPTTQKLIDYSGTEALQLIPGSGSATVQMTFTADKVGTNAAVTSVASTATILPNTWYNVQMTFNTAGNSLVNGDITGTESLYVNGVLAGSTTATKGSYGDSLNRPIGIGEFGYGHTTSILGLTGDIYSASVALGVPVSTPEPSSEVLLGMVGGLATVWKMRRKKA